MAKEYTPKTDGVTLMRHQIARCRTRIHNMERDGIEYKSPIVSIPLNMAIDIVDAHKDKQNKVQSILELSAELSFQMELQPSEWKPSKIKALADRIVILASTVR